MSFLEKDDDLINEYRNQGIKEGIERAKKDSYVTGFQEGVARGIEKGMLISFVKNVKLLLEENENNSNKLLKIINNIDYDNFGDLERKVKILKTNLILMNKNSNTNNTD